MIHTKDSCSAWDLFLITGGLQCGNCLAVELHPQEPARHIHQDLRDAIDAGIRNAT